MEETMKSFLLNTAYVQGVNQAETVPLLLLSCISGVKSCNGDKIHMLLHLCVMPCHDSLKNDSAEERKLQDVY